MTLPDDSLLQAERIAQSRNVNLSTVISEAVADGLRMRTAAERSDEVLNAYRKAFAGFSDEEMVPRRHHAGIEPGTWLMLDSCGRAISGGGPRPTFARPAAENRTTVSWNPDPTAGLGVDFRAGRFHIEPEVRYSYWGAGKNTFIRKNQVHFLLGFRF